LKHALDEANEKCLVITNAVEELKEKEYILGKELETKNNELKSVKKNLQKIEKSVETMVIQKQSEPTILLEI